MIEQHWYGSPLIVAAVVIAGLLQLMIARALPEGPHVMRTHAVIATVGLLITALGQWLPVFGPSPGFNALSELVVIGWGLLFIRIVFIAVFRMMMPAMKVSTPRILHEILFVIASLAWCMVRLRDAGMNLGGIVTTSAAITAIVAFSMQETLGNILGGLALQLDKSVHIGDWILLGGVRGKVVEVHWRHTAVLTPNGEVVVLPNSLLMKSTVTVISSVANPMARRALTFSTRDRVPPQEVIDAVEKALRDATITYVSPMPAPDCVVTNFADGNTEFAVRYWLLDQMHDLATDSAVRLHIYSALRRNEVALARPNLDMRVDGDTGGRPLLGEQDIDHRVQVLSGVALFAGMEESELRGLAAALRVTPFAKDEVITRQGAVAHWLYVLATGEVNVWYETRGGERRFVSTLAAGAVFGEMGMMTGAPRSATVTARTNAECYRIDKASFEGILRARPALASELAQAVSQRKATLQALREGDIEPDADEEQGTVLDRIRRFFKLPV